MQQIERGKVLDACQGIRKRNVEYLVDRFWEVVTANHI